MITLIISGTPVPWAAHKGYGSRSFNPRYKEREYVQWQLKAQYNRDAPLKGPIRLSCSFYLPIPKGTSAIRRKQMLNGVMHHLSYPNLSTMSEFIVLSMEQIIFETKNQIFEFSFKKIYSEINKVLIYVEEN